MSKAKKRKRSHKHGKKVTLAGPSKKKSNQNSKVEFVLDGAIYNDARRSSPITSNGSPRSRQDSRFFSNAGTFKYGSPISFEQSE